MLEHRHLDTRYVKKTLYCYYSLLFIGFFGGNIALFDARTAKVEKISSHHN